MFSLNYLRLAWYSILLYNHLNLQLTYLFLALMSYLEQTQAVTIALNQRWYCLSQVFLDHSGCLGSNYLLIAMTFERFYSIIRPLKAASVNTVKKARIIIICICLLSLSYCIPYLFISGYVGKVCVPNLTASYSVVGVMYSWMIESVTYLVPFVSLLVMNSVIIHTLRNRLKVIGSVSQGQGQSEGQSIKSKHSEKQIVTMLLLVTFVFLILNIPARALKFYRSFLSGHSAYYHAGLHLFYQIGNKSNITNHGINFFLYAMSGQKFRTDLKNLIFCKQSSRINGLVSHTVCKHIYLFHFFWHTTM